MTAPLNNEKQSDKKYTNSKQKKVYSTKFYNVAPAFDKVWHEATKKSETLPLQYAKILESYLKELCFGIKQKDGFYDLREIKKEYHRAVFQCQSKYSNDYVKSL